MKTVTATDIGLIRSENQDKVRADELTGAVFAAVCDGMGGERSGEKASKIALDAVFNKFISGYIPNMPIDNIKKLMLESFSEANSMVFKSSRQDYKDFGMGTTCVAALVTPDASYIANVGDSRAYLLYDGSMSQITVDHTYVRMLFERGDITEDEMAEHPKRNMLTKAIGVEKQIVPDYFEIKHNGKFKLMLCSDGLSGYCSLNEMQTILEGDDINAASEQLIKLAIDKGGKDNISLSIISD